MMKNGLRAALALLIALALLVPALAESGGAEDAARPEGTLVLEETPEQGEAFAEEPSVAGEDLAAEGSLAPEETPEQEEAFAAEEPSVAGENPAAEGSLVPAEALEQEEAFAAEEAPALEEAPGEEEPSEPGQTAAPDDAAQTEEARLPLTGVRIGIDPGHQAHGNSEKEAVAPGSSERKAKVSSGTSGVSTRIPEYVTVLEISLKLRAALAAQGAEVYMTRETHDVDISNQERAQMMNDLGVDLVLRIHCDGAENRSKNGIALYCSRSNSIAEESYRAAEAILPRVCEATGAKANGIVSNDNYTGQNWSTVPCLMVECGFMSNPEEDVKLNDEDYQWKLAAGLARGVADYIAVRDAEPQGR